MPARLARRTVLVLALLLAATPARAGTGFDDPALVARLLPSVVAVDVQVPAPAKDDPAAQKREHASGFVVGADGTILTNGHVVDHATSIRVGFDDGTVLPARLLYRAPVDLAILHVDAGRKLVPVVWGDSDRLRPGQGVIAIGNPLGVGLSVSAGVVSAVGREIPAAQNADFIQTDAALNHGNSGGPLFDLQGRVVGVTTGLLSPKGETGSIGIGLALPGNAVRFVLDSLLRHGRLREGWLGLGVARLTPAIADSLALPTVQGVMVTAAPPDTPAGHGGIRAGDVILRVGGRPIADSGALRRLVRTTPPGTRLAIALLRDGVARDVTVTAGEAALPPGRAVPRVSQPAESVDLGRVLAPLDQAARARWRMPDDTAGVLVAGIAAGSPAAGYGLAAGDVIVRVQWRAVGRPDQVLTRIAAARRAGRGHVLLVLRTMDGMRLVTLPLHR
jgi:serine protease Do